MKNRLPRWRRLHQARKTPNTLFMGSDLDDGQPTKIADSLVRKKILYKTPGSNLYSALLSADDDIPPVDVKFPNLLTEGEMQTVIAPKER